jgi:hypothetical protein
MIKTYFKGAPLYIASGYRNVAFARVPKTPPCGLPQAFESIRSELSGSGVPKTLDCGTARAKRINAGYNGPQFNGEERTCGRQC